MQGYATAMTQMFLLYEQLVNYCTVDFVAE